MTDAIRQEAERRTYEHLVVLAARRADEVTDEWLQSDDFNQEYVLFTAKLLLAARELGCSTNPSPHHPSVQP